jgi:hypothetical protein
LFKRAINSAKSINSPFLLHEDMAFVTVQDYKTPGKGTVRLSLNAFLSYKKCEEEAGFAYFPFV